ncbi:MAG: pyruvoyl-dependent arginine decarboxylase [Methanotrichaceae archaeon]|nr:pyruvoyl-dependent arginine decarboxylase [Methanotrichaceae archaeon]
MIFLVVLLVTPLAGIAIAKEEQANDDMGTMYGLVLGNRIPYEYFVTMGHNDTDLGPGDDHWETGSYDQALMNASIENFNVLKYTSVLPPESREITLSEAKKYFHHGAAIETIMSDLNGVKGDTLCTGVGRIWVNTTEGVLVGGFAAEYKKKYENQTVPEDQARMDAEEALGISLMGEVNRRYNGSEYQFSEPTFAVDYLQVQKNYGTSLVALCWVNYIFPQTEIA